MPHLDTKIACMLLRSHLNIRLHEGDVVHNDYANMYTSLQLDWEMRNETFDFGSVSLFVDALLLFFTISRKWPYDLDLHAVIRFPPIYVEINQRITREIHFACHYIFIPLFVIICVRWASRKRCYFGEIKKERKKITQKKMRKKNNGMKKSMNF